MYKCIPVAFGVDISVNRSSFFHFDIKTHMVTDLGEGKVRITRRIDGLHELYTSNLTDYTDVNGNVISTTASGLTAYFSIGAEGVKAGEGIAVSGNTVSVLAGGPATLGGYKVGTGLMVDGEGNLSATAVSESTKVLNTEAEMLSLAAEMLRPYRIIRLDTKRLYYLNAGSSPSVLANWLVGPSIEAAVVTFKSRSGAVVPEYGDYNSDLIPLVDKTTATSFKFVIDNGSLFVENIDTQERTQIAHTSDLATLQTSFTTLNDLVTNASNGISVTLGEVVAKAAALDSVVNAQTTGLVDKVKALEERPSGGADYSQEIAELQSKDTELNSLILAADGKADNTAASTVVISQRVSQLESKPLPKDYSPEITALTDKSISQDSRLGAIDTLLINKAPIVNGKVPYENLPEFPVGRKVNVANQASRLALAPYADLTIAYQSDTGDAWGLDANDDPAITANWSKLGNAQAVGVSSFNGRTGSIGPQTGDYNAGQISELLDKRFVTSGQITEWNEKPTTTQVDSKIAAAASNTNTRLTAVESIASLADLKGDSAATNILAVDTRLTQVNSTLDGKITTLTNGKMDKTEKGAANGVAPLVGGKVPTVNLTTNVAGGVVLLDSQNKISSSSLYRGVANGVASLDAATKVPIAQLPTFLPQKARKWVDVKAVRPYNTWWVNNSGNDMEVFLRTNALTDNAKYVIVNIRETSTSAQMGFQSTYDNATGSRYLSHQVTVPAGWQYAVVISGGSVASDINAIGVWRELS